MKTQYDIIVIGCGTSAGFFLSFLRDSGKKPKILILEKSPKIFRKLRASGNGRCNYSNLDIGEEQFYSFSADGEWKRKVLHAAKKLNLQGYFYKNGIPSESDEYKRLFPYTNSAVTIAEYFENVLKASGAQLQLNSEVTSIKKDSAEYKIEWTDTSEKTSNSAAADIVIFAAGGSAYPQFGTDGSALKTLKTLGHTVISQIPGIVPLESPDKTFRELDGMKLQTEIAYKDYRRAGELLFTDYGVSGPNVLYASNIVSMNLAKGPATLHINFLPKNELTIEYFEFIRKNSARKSLIDIFRGSLQVKFLNALLARNKNLEGELSEEKLHEAFKLLTHYPLEITKTRGFKDAQVSLGGVDCGEVNPDTFESNLSKKLFVLGEALDYIGGCGGYNIHWCAVTALTAVSSIW